MIRQQVNAIYNWLRRVITQPREELNRWQQAARFAYDLGRFGARQLRHDRAPQMAAALSFRALFGLVPVLVVATLLVRSVFGVDEFLKVVSEGLAWFGLDEVRIRTSADGTGQSQNVADWICNLIAEAAGVRLAAIGWMGVAVLSYAAVSLLVTIENVFNIIYRVADGRPWTRRVPLYWFLLTVSPIAIGMGALLNNQFETWLMAIDAWPWALATTRVLWIGFCSWGVMLIVYMLMPNAEVRFGSAAIGALVSVILLWAGKGALAATLQNAFSISQLHGSLGLVPLFMFWTYLMALAVLFGLQVSAMLQMLRGRRLEEVEQRRELTSMIEPASVISVMEVIAKRFEKGKSTQPDQISDALVIPRSTIGVMLDRLVEHRLLHRLENDASAVTLTRPAEQITAAQLIDVGFAMTETSGAEHSSFFNRLRDVQREVAGKRTLATLLSQSPV